ncbi:aldehyde dehydrogenase family protein, partial [Rhizobium ruizarguesonis]
IISVGRLACAVPPSATKRVSAYDQLVPRLQKAYGSVTSGNPLEAGTLVGPLSDGQAFEKMQAALGEAKAAGGTVTGGDRVDNGS